MHMVSGFCILVWLDNSFNDIHGDDMAMEMLPMLLILCEGNPLVASGIPS